MLKEEVKKETGRGAYPKQAVSKQAPHKNK
jgi:hypothetical protein